MYHTCAFNELWHEKYNKNTNIIDVMGAWCVLCASMCIVLNRIFYALQSF